MIQRFASMFASLTLGSMLSLSGCARPAPNAVPRILDGTTVRGPFVPPSAYEAYIRGELHLAAGRPREAVAEFELATTAPDEDAFLLSRLAQAQLASGDVAAAQRTLAHAETLDRCAEAVWLVRGALAEHANDLDGARAAYQHASACAPRSPAGELALAHMLERAGDKVGALELLVAAAARPYASQTQRALERSLASADPAALAHALASLSLHRAADSQTLQQAVRLALDRHLPRLAQRLAESTPAQVPPLLAAELWSALGARERVAALLAQHDADDLGGHARAARLALAAGAHERAELEATSALAEAPSEAMRVLRARAQIALQRQPQLLTDIAQVSDPRERRSLLLEALAQSGAPALAKELRQAAEAPTP